MAEFEKKFADAYYGPGNVIGDGTLLKMIMEFFKSFLGSCPLGARRAHAMINGGPFQKRRALARLQWEAYDITGGDTEMTAKLVDVGEKVGTSSSVEEFVDFAKP